MKTIHTLLVRGNLFVSSVLAAALLTSQAVSADGSVSLVGLWKNQRGSTLELRQEENKLSGFFTTAVAVTKTCIGYKAPVQGFANDNAISLSMSLEGCGSPAVISQSGILMQDENGKEKLKIQALVQNKGKESWDSQVLVTDYYQRINE